jgi:hypothetical protein
MRENLRNTLFIAALTVLTCGLASAQNHVLKSTYIDAGYYGSGLEIPSGNKITPVGSVVDIDCGGSTTCTLELDQSIQQTAGTTTGNEFQIGFYLDGQPQETFQQTGETPADESSVVSSTHEFLTIAAGAHTVQIAVESAKGCYVDNYSTVFRVYKP